VQDSDSLRGLIETSRTLENAGEIAAAYQAAYQAVDLARASAAPGEAAEALVQLANLEFRLGHYERARAICAESLQLAGPDSPARAGAWLISGNVAAETNSLANAENLYLKAADLSRSIGYQYVRIRSQHNLAMGVYFPRGQFELALASAEEAYHLAARTGYLDYLPYPLTTLTWIYQVTSRTALARQYLAELELTVLPGSLHEGYFHFLKGELSLDEGSPEQAPAAYLRARSIAEAIGEPGLNVQARLGMSRCRQMAADPAGAAAWAEDALAAAERARYDHMRGLASLALGRAAWMAGDLPRAEASVRQAIAILEPVQAAFDLARASLDLAGLLLERKSPEARAAWKDASRRILAGGYGFLVDREARRLYPLVGHFLSSPDESLRGASQQILERIARMAPAPLRVVCLGRFEVSQGLRRIPTRDLNQRRAGELLALLLFTPERCLSAEQVAEALWPEKDAATAQRLLHHSTSSLRQALEPDLPPRLPSRYLQVEEGQVRLLLPPGSWVDYEAFERHCRAGEWEAALSLYGGELLPPYLYADWSVLLRQRVEQWIQSALLTLAAQRLEEGRCAEALELGQRLLAIEPWQERGVWIAMRALQGLGDAAGALRLYRNLELTLRAELGVEPQTELQALAKALGRKKEA
jgi:DNA-binding SARP family transcriptional activator/tetratricopeptide (TPR) repeat protein